MSTTEYAKGRGWEITTDDGLASLRLWKLPEVDASGYARLADELAKSAERLARDPFLAHAAILDLRDAPAELSPAVQDALSRLLSAWEKAGRKLAIACGPDAVQRLVMQRLQHDRAPTATRVFGTTIEARAWIQGAAL